MADALTLKVDFEGDVRRIRLEPGTGRSPAALTEAACQLYNLPAGSLVLRYRDNEGDLCSLVEATMEDALELAASANSVLRVVATWAGGSPAASSALLVGSSPMHEPSTASEAAAAAEFEKVTAATEDAQHTAEEAMAAVEEAVEEQQEVLSAIAEDLRPAAAASGAGCGLRERLERAKPRVTAHMSTFGQQVVGDFKLSREDMKKAIVADSPQVSSPVRHVGDVVAATTGLLVAARMMPVRATRLVAETAAALSGTDQVPSVEAAESEEDAALDATAGATAASEDVAAPPSNEVAPEPVQGLRATQPELAHFAKQVSGDFKTVKREVRDVLGYVMGGTTSIGQPDGQRRAGQSEGRDRLPEVVGSLAGVAAAASLAPIRIVRAGVAAGGRSMRTSSTTFSPPERAAAPAASMPPTASMPADAAGSRGASPLGVLAAACAAADGRNTEEMPVSSGSTEVAPEVHAAD